MSPVKSTLCLVFRGINKCAHPVTCTYNIVNMKSVTILNAKYMHDKVEKRVEFLISNTKKEKKKAKIR